MCAADPNQEPIPTESDPVESTTPDRPETNSESTEEEQVLRKLPIKKIAVIAAIVFGSLLVTAILLAVILSVVGSSKDPIRNEYEFGWKTSITYKDAVKAYTNGWLSSEILGLADVLEDTEAGRKLKEQWKPGNGEEMEELMKKAHTSLEFTDEEPLSETDCEGFQDQLRIKGALFRRDVERYKGYSEEEKRSFADRTGLTVKDMDRAIAYYERMADELENCVVSEGVEHSFIWTIRYDEKEKEFDRSESVYKVNGYWVSEDYNRQLSALLKYEN